MRHLRTVLALCLAVLASMSYAHAGEKLGRISSIHMAQGHVDKVFVKIDAAYSQPEPACSVGVSSWDFVLDISTSTGKAMYALILAAQAAQTQMTVTGTNDCLLYPGYETLSYVITQT